MRALPIKLMVATLVSIICFASCKPVEPIYTIKLNNTLLSMTVGDMSTLIAETQAPIVTWKSSNDSIATVFHGVVTAVGVGYATISATVGDDQTAVCAVCVVGKDGETISLSPTNVQVEKGDIFQYNYTSSYDVPLVWESSDPTVATVDQYGKVTAIKSGRTVISMTNGVEKCYSNFAVKHKWSEYSLIWSEEFDEDILDESVWNVEVGGGGWGNKELQYYTTRPENLRVKNGCLEIEVRKEKYENRDYTSARINTREKKAFEYGKIEARICLPAGGGTWPAFWMMGDDYKKVGWPKCGEIDIMEHVGNNPTMLSFALHTPQKNGSSGNNWSAKIYSDNIEDNFHIYGIEWLKEEKYGCDIIHFTYDGNVCATIQENISHIDENYYWPFNKPHFIILNCAIGGNMGGKVDDSIFNQQRIMYVDWVRVYQRQEIQ